MNRTAFTMACLLAGVGVLLVAGGLMAQAVLPIIGLAVFTLSRVSGTSDAGEYVPDLGHYYTFAGLCIACGLVLAVAIYHRERQGASRPAPDAEAPASGAYQRAV